MEKEHPLDKFGRAVRTPLMIGAALCLPVMLFSYGWMIKALILAAPVLVSVAVIIAHFVVWLGISSLIDMRQERLSKPQAAPHGRPQPKSLADQR